MTKKTVKAVSVKSLASKIHKAAADIPPHVVVIARAGTGKTTTLIEGMKVMRGLKPDIDPSPQQKAIWNELLKSKEAYSVAFAAFGKAIADDLEMRIPSGCEAMTLHRMGSRILRKSFPDARMDTENKKTTALIEEYFGQDIRELRNADPELINGIMELTSKAKMSLVEDEASLQKLAAHFAIEITGGNTDELFSATLAILEMSKDLIKYPMFNFDDMIWIPVVLNLPVFKFDVLMVDEAQDLNRCQQELAFRAGKRLIIVGDPKQAIFGFAGADSNSIPKMQAALNSQPNGCVTLELNVTRRCGKKIVEEAQKIVPDFYSTDEAHDGAIKTLDWTPSQEKSYRDEVRDGDMVLCRVNGPLVSQCFKFIESGKKAQIIGRDIGQGLIYLVKRLLKVVKLDYEGFIRNTEMNSPTSLVDLQSALHDWSEQESQKESCKKVPSQGKLQSIEDRKNCILCFINTDSKSAADVVVKINQIFTDRTKDGIRMSSIHRAKGLEANRVFFLKNPKDCPCPHPAAKSPWERGQEQNLIYVAITRAKNELFYVV